MMNLLPPEEQRQLRAARANSLLLRYVILLFVVAGFLSLSVAVTYFYLTSTITSADEAIAENQAKVSGYQDVKKSAETFRSNLTTAKQILNNEVTYTTFILKLASLMPAGTVLDKLALDSQTFGTATTLSASAKTYDDAIELKDALQASALFEEVSFQSIVTNSNQNGYPLTITFNVTFKKGGGL